MQLMRITMNSNKLIKIYYEYFFGMCNFCNKYLQRTIIRLCN